MSKETQFSPKIWLSKEIIPWTYEEFRDYIFNKVKDGHHYGLYFYDQNCKSVELYYPYNNWYNCKVENKVNENTLFEFKYNCDTKLPDMNIKEVFEHFKPAYLKVTRTEDGSLFKEARSVYDY